MSASSVTDWLTSFTVWSALTIVIAYVVLFKILSAARALVRERGIDRLAAGKCLLDWSHSGPRYHSGPCCPLVGTQDEDFLSGPACCCHDCQASRQ